ncbi:hypothetical protein CKO36_08960 [Rhabdochromatium marinum]|nr:hypothetical protein [Rhabdochromatium marinum]
MVFSGARVVLVSEDARLTWWWPISDQAVPQKIINELKQRERQHLVLIASLRAIIRPRQARDMRV